jgi:hypothetical protein
MAKRKGDFKPDARGNKGSAPRPLLHILVASFLAAILSAGCASPGEPLERKALVPVAIADLAAMQQGDTVVLTFTLPKESVEHRALKEPPAIEIYRAFSPSQSVGSANALVAQVPTSPVLSITIPAAVVNSYSDQGFVRYVDMLRAEDFAQHSGWIARYTVRTKTSPQKTSADSNSADLPIFPAPDPIDDLKAEITHSAVVLRWSAPRKTIAGSVPPLSGYRIYRAEQESGAPPPGGKSGTSTAKSARVKIGEIDALEFRDTQMEFGKMYEYYVRSIATYPGGKVESADSNSVIVTPKDIFPPAAPEGLVVVLVPAQTDAPASLDISWAISPETDIAGYNLYRSNQVGIPGQRLNAEPLLTPAFRDMNAVPGQRYFYTITAVDRSGNESSASSPVFGGVPAENSPAQ